MSHFNKEANEWDNPGKVQMMETLARKALEKLNLSKKLDIMDFGAGTGLFSLAFKDYIGTLMAIDTSSGMLEVFDRKTAGFANMSSVNINLEKEVLDKKFDLIVSSMAFHHLVEPGKLLKKLKTNLNDGGKIAVVDLVTEDGGFHPDNAGMGVKHFGFSKEELDSWAKEAEMNLEYTVINSIPKNGKEYEQFLAVFR